MIDKPAGNTNRQRMPALFIGHGNPMNAIEDTSFAAAWQEQAEQFPRPQAILCISAHWETHGSQVTAMPQPRTIHDFYGFPDKLFAVQYPAPGSEQLAHRVRELAAEYKVAGDRTWGLDHGAWSVLRRMYPAADIPTVQLSLDRNLSPKQHVDLARKLAPLRAEGILILGSGNIVHNLPLMRWQNRQPYAWAEEFDELASRLIIENDVEQLAAYESLGEAARQSIPTNEHYLPLLYALAQREEQEPVSFFAEGIVLSSVSMRSVRIG